MTSHTITDPPHRITAGEKYTAWIKTADHFFVQLHIAGIATQEQAERFVREAVVAPEILENATRVLAGAESVVLTDAAGNRFRKVYANDLDALQAAIAKATGTAP